MACKRITSESKCACVFCQGVTLLLSVSKFLFVIVSFLSSKLQNISVRLVSLRSFSFSLLSFRSRISPVLHSYSMFDMLCFVCLLLQLFIHPPLYIPLLAHRSREYKIHRRILTHTHTHRQTHASPAVSSVRFFAICMGLCMCVCVYVCMCAGLSPSLLSFSFFPFVESHFYIFNIRGDTRTHTNTQETKSDYSSHVSSKLCCLYVQVYIDTIFF
jgi:hypothetical protein